MTARLLPDWLKAYGEFTAENEAPEIFHLWVAIGTVAGAAQRKVMMQSKYFDVHSNLYILLVSPPGRGKKSTALRIGKNLLKDVEPKVNFATESASAEALVGILSKISNPAHQSMTLYSSELGTLMSTNAPAMVDFLVDIYDCNPDWSRQTVAHNLQAIKKPWLNIMGGTTPRWLGENMGVVAVEGGLSARMIMPYSEARILKSPFPKDDDKSKALWKALLHDLCIIAALEGEFKFSANGYEFYERWFMDESRFPTVADPRTASYYDRKHIHLLKVAMALSLTYKDELVLEREDIERALTLLTSSEPGMRLALSAVGKNESSAETYHILSQIKSKRTMSYRDLLTENYHNLGKKGLDIALDELKFMGKVRQEGMLYVISEA